jgi:hypothetical protein
LGCSKEGKNKLGSSKGGTIGKVLEEAELKVSGAGAVWAVPGICPQKNRVAVAIPAPIKY